MVGIRFQARHIGKVLTPGTEVVDAPNEPALQTDECVGRHSCQGSPCAPVLRRACRSRLSVGWRRRARGGATGRRSRRCSTARCCRLWAPRRGCFRQRRRLGSTVWWRAYSARCARAACADMDGRALVMSGCRRPARPCRSAYTRAGCMRPCRITQSQMTCYALLREAPEPHAHQRDASMASSLEFSVQQLMQRSDPCQVPRCVTC